MKALIGVAALCIGLCACGGDNHPMAVTPPASQPPPPASVSFSVNDVLKLAKAQSETDDPKSVNGGEGGSVTGSDDTSDPVMVE